MITQAFRDCTPQRTLEPWTCPFCIQHPGWDHADESRRREPADVCRSCFGTGISTLFREAGAAYNRNDRDWFYGQSTQNLTILWGVACDIETMNRAEWDDEVYDALAARGYFEEDQS